MREYDQVANMGTKPVLRDRVPVTDRGADLHPGRADTVQRNTVLELPSSHAVSGHLRKQPGRITQHKILQLQRSCGNQFVQRALGVSLAGEGDPQVNPDVERTINTARGGGQSLDNNINAQMSDAFGTDFSGVRLHVGSEADALNRTLNARAFTTGKDVFFRQGAYNPGTSGGRELLAHELTHVVQQNGEDLARVSPTSMASETIQPQLTVGRPDDIYEQEADRVARAFMRWEQRPVKAQDGGSGLQQQQLEEEKREDMVQTKPQDRHTRVSCQTEEEEEPLQTKLYNNGMQRQPEEGEENTI